MAPNATLIAKKDLVKMIRKKDLGTHKDRLIQRPPIASVLRVTAVQGQY